MCVWASLSLGVCVRVRVRVCVCARARTRECACVRARVCAYVHPVPLGVHDFAERAAPDGRDKLDVLRVDHPIAPRLCGRRPPLPYTRRRDAAYSR